MKHPNEAFFTTLNKPTRVIEWQLNHEVNPHALVVLPENLNGETSAALWLHSAVGTPEDLVNEASEYTSAGVISIIACAPYAKSRVSADKRGPGNPAEEARIWQKTAQELTRFLDRAQSEFSINLDKSFAVGFNYGGSQIARWLKIDKRISNAICTGSIPDLSQFWLTSPHPISRSKREQHSSSILTYTERIREFDLVESIKSLPNHNLLFQFGIHDDWIDLVSVKTLTTLKSANHHIQWIHDSHDMQSPESRFARKYWINKFLCTPDAESNVAPQLPNI